MFWELCLLIGAIALLWWLILFGIATRTDAMSDGGSYATWIPLPIGIGGVVVGNFATPYHWPVIALSLLGGIIVFIAFVTILVSNASMHKHPKHRTEEEHH